MHRLKSSVKQMFKGTSGALQRVLPSTSLGSESGSDSLSDGQAAPTDLPPDALVGMVGSSVESGNPRGSTSEPQTTPGNVAFASISVESALEGSPPVSWLGLTPDQ
jgi:hypothetical protein